MRSDIPVCSAQTLLVAAQQRPGDAGAPAAWDSGPMVLRTPERTVRPDHSLVQRTNRNGSRKEPRDENISTCPGIRVFDVGAGMYLHAAHSLGATALAVPTGECYTLAERVPASVRQGVLRAVGSARHHEMRVQHGVAARHALSLGAGGSRNGTLQCRVYSAVRYTNRPSASPYDRS
jgi:hypothetical protein